MSTIPFDYDIGQAIIVNGVHGRIARKTKFGKVFDYWMIESNPDGSPGDGKLIKVDGFIPVGDPPGKPVHDHTAHQQAMIPGTEDMISDRAKKRAHAV